MAAEPAHNARPCRSKDSCYALGLRPPSSWQDLVLEPCPPGGLPHTVLLLPGPDLAPAVGVGGLSWRRGPQREGLREPHCLPRVRPPSCLGWPGPGREQLHTAKHFLYAWQPEMAQGRAGRRPAGGRACSHPGCSKTSGSAFQLSTGLLLRLGLASRLTCGVAGLGSWSHELPRLRSDLTTWQLEI